MNNTRFIGFTSAAGGSGCTSCGVLLARTAAGVFKKRVLFLGLDALSCKAAPKSVNRLSSKRMFTKLLDDNADFDALLKACISTDDFGVCYAADTSFYNPFLLISKAELLCLLRRIAESDSFDVVILDIPFKNSLAEELCSCCEDLIVVSGYRTSQTACNNDLYMHLDFHIKSLVNRPKMLIFASVNDPESFDGSEVDIHGQLGTEVRRLAEELFEGE